MKLYTFTPTPTLPPNIIMVSPATGDAPRSLGVSLLTFTIFLTNASLSSVTPYLVRSGQPFTLPLAQPFMAPIIVEKPLDGP